MLYTILGSRDVWGEEWQGWNVRDVRGEPSSGCPGQVARVPDASPWSWPISDLCTFGNMEALISRGFLRCFLWVWRSSGPQGLRGLPQGLTSGPHFNLRASPAQKLVIILDQGPPRFLGGPEVNFPNQWMDTVDKIRVKSAQWTNISMVANKKKKNKLQYIDIFTILVLSHMILKSCLSNKSLTTLLTFNRSFVRSSRLV